MSTLKVNDIEEATTGGGKIWPARAWVRFNAQSTLTINASKNTSSVTDLGTGYYTHNLSNAMTDANYAISGMSNDGDANGYQYESYFHVNAYPASSYYTVWNTNSGSAADDTTVGCLLVTR